MSKPIIPYLIPALAILIILIGIFAGCDNINCNPNVRPEDDKGNWFFGGSCRGEW